MSDFDLDRAFAGLFRESYGRITSVLAKEFRDLELAEDALQEALAVAARRWPDAGIPDNAAGWLYVVARRKAIDSLRKMARQRKRFQRNRSDVLFSTTAGSAVSGMSGMYGIDDPPDERLSLIFACCHPGINESDRIALTLQALSGLNTTAIAAAFLVQESTVAQRIVRAKRKIKTAGIPFAIPDLDKWPERLSDVLSVIYLIFNEGYTATRGPSLVKTDLCDEGIFLARMLVTLLGNNSEAQSLLALLLFQDSRRAARISHDGSPILLKDQDRSRWDANKIKEGMEHLGAARSTATPGMYLLQAEIAAVHARSSGPEDTSWSEILHYYDRLIGIYPTAVVHLNRAVALKMVMGAQEALNSLEDREMVETLRHYRYFHSTRGEFLLELERSEDAIVAFSRALELTDNEAERKHLNDRLEAATMHNKVSKD